MWETIAISIITAFVTAAATGIAAFAVQERKLRAEMRTEFMAEQAVRSLLEHPRWRKRSFDQIKRRLGEGFEENELRRVLVRAGAVCFTSREDEELWGLASRNKENLQ